LDEFYDSSSEMQMCYPYQEDPIRQVPTKSDFLKLLPRILLFEKNRGTDLPACFLKQNINTVWIWLILLEYAAHWAGLRFHDSNTFFQKVNMYSIVHWSKAKCFCTCP